MEKNGEARADRRKFRDLNYSGSEQRSGREGELDRQPKVLSQTDQGCRPIAYQYKKSAPSSFDGAPFFHSEQLIKLQ